MTTVPDTRPRGRLYREARDLLVFAALIASAPIVYRVLSAVLPWRIWWPILAGLVVLAGLAWTTPAGSTTVQHGVKSAGTHPGTATLVAAVVCLPWLAGWIQAAIVTGAREAFSAALGAVPHPSLDPAGLVDRLKSLIPGGPR